MHESTDASSVGVILSLRSIFDNVRTYRIMAAIFGLLFSIAAASLHALSHSSHLPPISAAYARIRLKAAGFCVCLLFAITLQTEINFESLFPSLGFGDDSASDCHVPSTQGIHTGF